MNLRSEPLELTLPHKFKPRDYQLPLMQALDDGFDRLVAVWHRRAGKDKTLINVVAKKALERVGTYFYLFPTYSQGRKVLWNGRDKDGLRFLDHIPKQLIKRINSQEMLIELINGSIIQIVGTDNVDSILGTNPIGVVFSEYSLQDPIAWSYIKPILIENGGWAIFNFTPRGENHAYDLYEYARKNPKWFCQLLTVEDTKVVPKEKLESIRLEYIAEHGDDSLFWQELYCDFKVPIQGSYYGKLLQKAEQDGRVSNVPYEPQLPVNTYWDLGIDDSMTIWFVQFLGKERRIIDYYENSGEGLKHYIQVLQDRKYIYGDHWAPHDIEVRELTTGKSRLETARSLGIDFNVAPRLSVSDGIDAVRNVLAKCWFDKEKTSKGLNALKHYHKEFDKKNKVYRKNPKHDWSSHGADAFRCFAVVEEEETSYDVPSSDQVNQGVISY